MPDIKRQERDSAHSHQTNRPMGIGKLGGSNMIFVRKFRFSLTGSHLEDWSIKAVSVDLTGKMLRIKGYEVIDTGDNNKYRTPNTGNDAPIEVWAQGLSEGRWPQEVLMLTTFDGCGKALYEYTFEGLSMLDRRLDFNMASSDESCQRLVVGFKTYKRRFLLDKPADYRWRMLLHGADREIDVHVEGRPNINIEETPIDFMNGKMWLPGKTKWQNLLFTVGVDDVPALTKLINTGANEEYTAAILKYYDGNNELKETWSLGGLWARGFERYEEYAQLRVSFDKVGYEANLPKLPLASSPEKK